MTASAGSALALGFSSIVAEAFGKTKPAKISLEKDDVILFQGDSITDWWRNADGFERTVWCWGLDTSGQAGIGKSVLVDGLRAAARLRDRIDGELTGNLF